MSLARRFGIPFIEVSAKTAANVNDGFEMLVKEIHRKFEQKGEFEGLVSKREIMIGKKHIMDGETKQQCSC